MTICNLCLTEKPDCKPYYGIEACKDCRELHKEMESRIEKAAMVKLATRLEKDKSGVEKKIFKLISEASAKTGAIAALEAWDNKKKQEQRERRNKQLWNTRILLKHYKALQEYCRNAIYDKDTAVSPEKPIEILESLGCYQKDMYIDAIKSSVVRTRTIMAHIDKMLMVYKISSEISDKEDEQRKYRVLFAHYFTDSHRDSTCQAEKIDKSTYYRDLKASTETLTGYIFGADGLISLQK